MRIPPSEWIRGPLLAVAAAGVALSVGVAVGGVAPVRTSDLPDPVVVEPSPGLPSDEEPRGGWPTPAEEPPAEPEPGTDVEPATEPPAAPPAQPPASATEPAESPAADDEDTGGPLEDATDLLDDTVQDTSDTVDDAVDATDDAVEDVLDDVTETLQDTVTDGTDDVEVTPLP